LRLQLSFKENGEIIPTVEFQVIDSNGRHAWQESKCPPFYFPNFRVTEGKRYFGLDFGTSNSYMVEFISSTIEPPSTASYPELRVSQKTVQRLRELSLQLDQLRLEGILTRSRILKHAADSALNFVFHSNKIEGSPLTIGETEVLATQTSYLSTDEKEALGAKTAYDWMVENCESVLQSP